MKVPPPKDAEVPFGGQPIHVDVLLEGTTASRPTAPNSNVRLQEVEAKARRSSTRAKVMMATLRNRQKIQISAQKIGKPRQDGLCRQCNSLASILQVFFRERRKAVETMLIVDQCAFGQKGG